MKLNTHEKEIIKKIASGEITDIPSYLKSFNLSTFRQLNREKMEENFKISEKNKTYKCLKKNVSRFNLYNTTTQGSLSDLSIPNLNVSLNILQDDDFEYLPAKLDYSDSTYSLKIGDSTNYVYDYFEGINIVNSFSSIKTFLTIWQFLKSEGLILEVDKKVSRHDYEPFFEYKPIENTLYGVSKQREKELSHKKNNDSIKPSNLPLFEANEEGSIKDYREFTEYYFEYNKTNELICAQFLNKQIYGTSNLDIFIKKKFKTNEQINLTKALIPAYLALILALLIALWQKASEDNSDIIQIQNQLNQIQSSLENIQSNDLYNIEVELQTIIDNPPSSAAVIETQLDEILNELKEANNIE